MKITLKIILICFLLCSCKETSNDLNQESEKSQDLKELEEALNELTEDTAVDKEEITSVYNDDVKIKFANLTVSLKDMNVFWWEAEGNNDDNIYETKKDTVYFDLNPGDEVFEKSFRIEQTAFDIIELYGQFEIKVALETKRELEVPVCILENWKGYTSKWKKLKIDKKDLTFGALEEKIDDPINFALDEFKLAVEKYCGPEWLNDIKHIDTVDKLPTDFFTTKYIYKIKVKNSKTNEVIEKFIVFYTPTSC
jgi:hypothetical protein